ncbi:ribosome maturation factor RimM [Demetria terragena]|uniref:ribosome maturation factor RimM n=1 Tax=Demetria terragena TaxID=63959 RepID=UPI000375F3E3|nr:ribosome maturation factor RimM [Demetria terragena]
MSEVMVARIGKAHGLKGEVTVQLHTDSPKERFIEGASFATEPAGRGPLTIRAARMHNAIQLLAFDGVSDRTAAEGLRGVRLLAETDDSEDDAWYAEDLIGMSVVDTAGAEVGRIAEVVSRPAQDLLTITKSGGGTAYVPFVDEMVPEVDLDSGRVVIDPPPGLLDLEG